MNTETRRKKLVAGLFYGLAAGFAFALFTWGIDAYKLAQANGAFYWVRFVPGLLICLIAGALVGWLTVHNLR